MDKLTNNTPAESSNATVDQGDTYEVSYVPSENHPKPGPSSSKPKPFDGESDEEEFKPPRAYIRGGPRTDMYDFRDEYAPKDASIDQPTYAFRAHSHDIRTSAPIPFDQLVQDMTSLTQDGGVKKRLLVEGDTSVNVVDGSRVWVHYETYAEFPLTFCKCKPDQKVCTCEAKFLDSTRLHEFATSLKIGEQGMYGLQVGIKSMKKMEISEFIVDPIYAYGNLGIPGFINKNSRVRMIIQLMAVGTHKKLWEFLKPDEVNSFSEQYSMEERVESVTRLIGAGEQKMLWSHVREATDRFCIAMTILEDDLDEATKSKLEVARLKYKTHCFLTDCYMRREMYEPALQECDKALAIEACSTGETKVEILKYKTNALFHLGKFDDCMKVALQGETICSDKDLPSFNRIRWKVLSATGQLGARRER